MSAGWRSQFVLLAAIWGSSFLFIKVLDRHLPPLYVALGRVAIGALTLVAIVGLRRERLPAGRRTWEHLVVTAILFNAAPFTLFAYGETKVPSVVAGLWNATTPLLVLVFVLLVFREERPDQKRIAGLGLGFVGVALVLGPWDSIGDDQLIGHLACFGAAACYGLGFPYTRRYLGGRPESGVALAAGQLLCATAILAALAPLSPSPHGTLGIDAIGSLLALGALGSGVAYVLNWAIVRAAGAPVAATVTYLIPLFSTVLGVVVLSEPLHWNEPVGAIVVLTGIAIAQGEALRRRRRDPDRVAARTLESGLRRAP